MVSASGQSFSHMFDCGGGPISRSGVGAASVSRGCCRFFDFGRRQRKVNRGRGAHRPCIARRPAESLQIFALRGPTATRVSVAAEARGNKADGDHFSSSGRIGLSCRTRRSRLSGSEKGDIENAGINRLGVRNERVLRRRLSQSLRP